MKIKDAKFDPQAMNHFGAIAIWAVDFIYALEDRPWICRFLFKLAIGKYAWREFCGMFEKLIIGGHYTDGIGYSLQDQEYHAEKPELWGMK